jgi:DNA-binding XRE family transcriptional regulator
MIPKQPITTSLSSFASFIYTRRRVLHLTPVHLARRAGLPVETVELLEDGKLVPSPSQAYRLGVALHVVDPAAFAESAVSLLLLHPQYLLQCIGTMAA